MMMVVVAVLLSIPPSPSTLHLLGREIEKNMKNDLNLNRKNEKPSKERMKQEPTFDSISFSVGCFF